MKIANTELGRVKSELTEAVIYLVLESCNFEADGKIIQKKVAAKSGRSESTVKRYWTSFKDYAATLNADWLKLVANARIDSTVPLLDRQNKMESRLKNTSVT